MTLLRGQFWTLRLPQTAWGLRDVFRVANPAAGTDWEWKPRPGFFHVPIAIRAELKTNAEAGERFPELQLLEGNGLPLIESPVESFASASETLAVMWHKDGTGPSKVVNHKLGLWMPTELLDQGFVIRVVTTGLKATDQWENIRVWAEEFEISPQHDDVIYRDLRRRVEHLERSMVYAEY